jgi:acylpyruvate hydrolase
MRLATVKPPGIERPVAAQIVDGLAVAFPSNWTVLQLLSIDAGDRPPPGRAAWPVADVELLAPIPQPVAIFGIGRNYAAHAAELGNDVPEIPTVFAKLSRSSTAPGGPIRLPAAAEFVDYEGELAVIMGHGGKVAGYAIANDVSARDLQFLGGDQWTRGKGADTFCPWGPWITTEDEVPDPHDLHLRTYVNGDLRQEAITSDLIFKIPRLIDHISEITALQPGDMILTGTPAGVGWAREPREGLASGDVVRIEIDLLGSIESRVA